MGSQLLHCCPQPQLLHRCLQPNSNSLAVVDSVPTHLLWVLVLSFSALARIHNVSDNPRSDSLAWQTQQGSYCVHPLPVVVIHTKWSDTHNSTPCHLAMYITTAFMRMLHWILSCPAPSASPSAPVSGSWQPPFKSKENRKNWNSFFQHLGKKRRYPMVNMLPTFGYDQGFIRSSRGALLAAS